MKLPDSLRIESEKVKSLASLPQVIIDEEGELHGNKDAISVCFKLAGFQPRFMAWVFFKETRGTKGLRVWCESEPLGISWTNAEWFQETTRKELRRYLMLHSKYRLRFTLAKIKTELLS